MTATPTSPPPGPPPGVPPTTPPAGPAGARGARLRSLGSLRRSPTDRVIAGVAGGLAHHLGVDAVVVRIVFAVLSLAGGTGLLLYGLLWFVVPTAEGPQPVTRPATAQQAIALALIAVGVLGLLRAAGLWFGDALVLPIALAAAGSAIVWTRSDSSNRAAFDRLGQHLPTRAMASAGAAPVSPIRIVVGTILIAAALAGFLAANDAILAARDLVIALLAASVGIGLLFGPWLWRVRTELLAERRQRIRQEERAELAAHLHDSVLQTLALIQRTDEPARMVSLARRQERELRSWLYGDATAMLAPGSLAAAAAALVEEIESTHEFTVELVTVGDAPLEATGHALIGATREAVVNAAKHAGVASVDLYLEAEPDHLTAFVRDRGVGFDPSAIPSDRQGIRRSIVARIERHGGVATIHSAPGAGTEVELRVPRAGADGQDRS